MGGPPPPPMRADKSNMTIKRALQPKVKLPTLNWTVLKPREVKGTVFNQLDDSKYYNVIDFDQFERIFKIGPAGNISSKKYSSFVSLIRCKLILNTVLFPGRNSDEGDGEFGSMGSKRFKKPELLSLMEHTRLRNIGK
jgi:hypothetical protein